MKKNKGFTLVELIIVVAIIAILAAVLAPQYLRYVERARQSNDLQTATNLLRAATVAVADPKNQLPSGYFIEVLWATSDTTGQYSGDILIRYPYSGSGGAAVGRTSIFNTAGSANAVAPLTASVADKDALENLAKDVIGIMGATPEQQSDPNISFGYTGQVGDAESEIGNSTNFCFHLSTSTGEVALARWNGDGDVNEWLEIGVDVIPAP